MKLRPYQRESLAAIYAALAAGVTRPAIVKATGLGKTVTFSHLIAQWLARHGGRVLVLVHRDELAEQARAKILAVEPGLSVGIVKASRNEVDAQVIIGSVQTLARDHRRDQVRGITLIVADECHHAAARTWKEVMRHFGAWDGVPCVGFTATMHREDGRGLGEVWEDVVLTRDIVWGVTHRYDAELDQDVRCADGETGYLVRPRGLRVRVPRLHLEDKRLIVAGEFQKDRVAAAMINADTGPAIARAVLQYAPDKRLATFGSNVAACESFVDAYLDHGLTAELITGKTPKHQRLASYARFESGHTKHLVTPMVLTEGWDAPWCDGVVIARPTKNPGLFQQMVGRAVRTHGDKNEAIVIDVAGATDVATLSSLADLGFDDPTLVRERKPKDDFDEDELLEGADDPYEIEPEVDRAPVKEVHATDVDFFSNRSRQKFHWLKTRAGVPFLIAGTELIFLWPDVVNEGLFTVGMTNLYRTESATPIGSGLTPPDATDVAEKLAAEANYVSRSPVWRSTKARWGSLRNLARYGVSAPPGATQGDVQDMIDIAMAERKLGVG